MSLMLAATSSVRAEPRALEAKGLSVRADTSDTHGVRVALDLVLVGDLAKATISSIDSIPSFDLVRNGQTLFPNLQTEFQKHGVRLVLPLNQSTLARFRSFGDLADAEIRPSQPFTMTVGESEVTVSPEVVEAATHGRWVWAADSLVNLWKRLDVVQTGQYLGNFVDAGRRTEKDSKGDDVFAGRFSLSSPFGPTGNTFHVEGDWSTMTDDSTNHIHVDPVNIRMTTSAGKTSNLTFRSGIDSGRLGFSRQGRATAGIVWESLIPNLLDLTAGSPRFRLKPIITAWVEGFEEWSDHKIPNDDRIWGQAKIGYDYDVPVFSRQLARLHAEGHFPFRSKATDQDFKYEYSIQLVTEVAGGKLQPVLSFSNGADDINRKRVTRAFLGLWLDAVPLTGH